MYYTYNAFKYLYALFHISWYTYYTFHLDSLLSFQSHSLYLIFSAHFFQISPRLA